MKDLNIKKFYSINLNELQFEKIIKATQNDLLEMLPYELEKNGMKDIQKTDSYILAHGSTPILLVAHLDTVHSQVVTIEKNNGIWSSPSGIGGDDRCGVYMILDIIKNLPLKPYVLFTTDEEIGGIGVKKFLNDFPYNEFYIKFMIEFDRKGSNEAVFYDCKNEKFIEFITENLKMKFDYGSFTDICFIMESWNVAGVNLSCGYHNAHTKKEYIVINEMLNVIEKSIMFLSELDYITLENFESDIFSDDYFYYDVIDEEIFCDNCLDLIDIETYYDNFGLCGNCINNLIKE